MDKLERIMTEDKETQTEWTQTEWTQTDWTQAQTEWIIWRKVWF